jgi:hypothetical protein
MSVVWLALNSYYKIYMLYTGRPYGHKTFEHELAPSRKKKPIRLRTRNIYNFNARTWISRTPEFCWSSCCSNFCFLCTVLWIIVWSFVCFLLTIALSVLLLFTSKCIYTIKDKFTTKTNKQISNIQLTRWFVSYANTL